MKDLISVIVLVYRVEQYLEQCIQSIQSQTYKNLEILLICRDSDDKCAEICDRYADMDSRIIVIHHKGVGVDTARKLGITYANGKYVGYVDGDDWIEADMYEKLHEYATLYDVDVVESGAIDMWKGEEKKRLPYFSEGCYKGKCFEEIIETKLLYSGNFFQHGVSGYMWSKLFLRNSLEKYQLMPDLLNDYIDDIMVSLPCIAQTKSIYITHNCYYHYRVHANNGKCMVKESEGLKMLQCCPDIFKRFNWTHLCKKGDKQIQYFIMYWLLLRAPEIFDALDEEAFLVPYGGIKRKSRIILYGAGMAGRYMKHYVQSVQECKVVCWVDQHFEAIKGGHDICNPKQITELDFDYIVISIMRANAVSEVRSYLDNLGVASEKILWIEQKYIDNPLLLLGKATYNGKPMFERLEEYYA